MSLVTRCASCGTVFRVVQDQLKVSSGWVRCGRCGEVFNALQTLFDLERDVLSPTGAAAPPGLPSPDHRVLRDAAAGHPPASPPAASDDRWRNGARAVEPAAAPVRPPPAPPPARTAVEAPGPADSFAASAPSPEDFPASMLPDDPDTGGRTERPDGRSIWPSDSMPSRWIEPPRESALPAGAASDSRQLVVVSPDGETTTADQPEFLREDQRRARWSSPLARGLLGSAAVGLAVLLGAQVAIHQRDKVADLWPWSRPMLVQACRIGGCEVLEAPRRLESFTVESTALTKVGTGVDTYRLTITLRNRGARAAMLPSVELSLLDGEGQLLSRRALDPADFRVQRPVVPAGADTTLQLLMTAGRGRVNGFTIEIFYP